jgi:hypothetical protein
MSAGGGLLVGSIYAKLGAIFDPKGFKEQEASALQAKRLSEKPILAHTGATHDASGFTKYFHNIGHGKTLTKDFEHDTVSLREHVGKLSFGIGGLAQNIMGGAAGFGLYEALKHGIERMGEMEKSAAATTSALKNNGGAAKVNAKEIDELALAIFRKTGVDHEQVKSVENTLLAYKNVHNEVGKGHDVFNRATRAAVDLSVATGRDLKYSAESLAVALNNPTIGLTRLSRAGIVLSAQQKDQIKTMQEQGNLFGAQDVVLKLLEDRYKGTADAAGKTLPAAWNKAKVTVQDLVASLAKHFAPALERGAELLVRVSGEVRRNVGVGHDLRLIWEGLAGATKAVIGWTKDLFDLFKGSSKEAEIFRAALVGLVGAFIGLKAIKQANDLLTTFFSIIGKNPLTIIIGALAALLVYLDQSGVKFKNLGQWLESLWKKVKHQVGEVVDAVKHFVQEHKHDIESMGKSVETIGKAFLEVGKHILGLGSANGLLHIMGDAIIKAAGAAIKLTADILKFLATKEGLAIIGAAIGALVGHLVALAAAWAIEKALGFAYALQKVGEAVTLMGEAISKNPLGAFLTVVGLVAGALIGFSSKTKAATMTTREYNESLREQRDLLRELGEADMNRKEKELAVKEAVDNLRESEQRVHEIDKTKGHSKQERETAEHAVERARLERERAERNLRREPKESGEKREKAYEDYEDKHKANVK